MYRSSQSWSCDTTDATSTSNSRSSRAPANYHGAQYTDEGLRKFDTQSSASGHATAIEVFVATLHESNLPGPVILLNHTGERDMLGRGSQFVVYKQQVVFPQVTHFLIHEVAVKVPMFELNPNAQGLPTLLHKSSFTTCTLKCLL